MVKVKAFEANWLKSGTDCDHSSEKYHEMGHKPNILLFFLEKKNYLAVEL